MVLELLVSGGSDATDLAAGQHRLEDVGGIHRPAARGAGADDRVDLVDEENRIRTALQLGDDALETLLEVPPELGSGEHAAQIQGVDMDLFQQVGHLALGDVLGEPLGQGGLADPRVADKDGIVLAPAAEHLHGALDLGLAADERVKLSLAGLADQIRGVHLERTALAPPLLGSGPRVRLLALLKGCLGNFVRDVVQYIEPRHALGAQKILGVGVLLQEDGGQDVAHRHLGLVGGTGMADRPLDHPLKPDGLLQDVFAALGNFFDFFLKKALQLPEDGFDVAAAVLDDFDPALLVEDGEQNVLDADVFVPALLGFAHGEAQRSGQFLTDHKLSLFPWCT